MTYVFKCPVCGYTVEQSVRDPGPTCIGQENEPPQHFAAMQRDYRAEGVAIDKRGLR